MFLKRNMLLKSYYQVKKIFFPMGMEYQKIHACPNNYILYRSEFEEKQKCPKCRVSRYKVKDDDECSSDESTNKGPLVKVLWYLAIIPRCKHLFANADEAKDLTWDADERNCDGMLLHPADCSQWKKIPLRLGLSSDGMNSYGSLTLSTVRGLFC